MLTCNEVTKHTDHWTRRYSCVCVCVNTQNSVTNSEPLVSNCIPEKTRMLSMEKSRISKTNIKKIEVQNNGCLFYVLFVTNALYQNQSGKYFTFKLHTFYVSAFVENWRRSGDFIIVFWDVRLCNVVDGNRRWSWSWRGRRLVRNIRSYPVDWQKYYSADYIIPQKTVI
jgi:hypothetical protein